MQDPSSDRNVPRAAGLVEEAAGAGIRLLKSVRKKWPLVAALALFATAASVIYVKVATPVYQAESLVEINPHIQQPAGEDSTGASLDLGASQYWDTHEYYETQYKIIRSDRLLGTVVRDLGLTNDADFVG